MLRKAVLMVLISMLVVFGASISYANLIDGMESGTGPALPATLVPSINPGGIGDTLVYGYYNVRGNLNLFNIVNTDTVNGVKVRVVFRNAKNSKEVLDFTVCLSRGDVWTAFLADDGVQARIWSFDDDTLTAPTIPVAGQPFISGTFAPFTVSADDTREGYFETYGLRMIPLYDHNVSSPVISTEAECRDFTAGGDAQNSLMGNNTIFDLSTLATYSLNATAIIDFQQIPIFLPSGQEPSMANIAGGCPAADFILSKDTIYSPYDLLAEIGGETELLLTFPTRLACHATTAQSDMFNATATTPGGDHTAYCTDFGLSIWTDDERVQDITDFSPVGQQCLPWEVNVLRIGGSSIWNSTVSLTASTSFTLGWVALDMTAGDPNHQTTVDGVTIFGLPTIAHTTQSFVGGLASYLLPAFYSTVLPN